MPDAYRTLRVQLLTYMPLLQPRTDAFKGSVVGLKLETEQNQSRHKTVVRTEHTTRGP